MSGIFTSHIMKYLEIMIFIIKHSKEMLVLVNLGNFLYFREPEEYNRGFYLGKGILFKGNHTHVMYIYLFKCEIFRNLDFYYKTSQRNAGISKF